MRKLNVIQSIFVLHVLFTLQAVLPKFVGVLYSETELGGGGGGVKGACPPFRV